jgi:NDP-sugar pyrophosphorylase family protein
MQVVILAGGLGTRMLPLTETIPKPMLPVAGRPFLQHQLELVSRHGLRRVLLLVGYLGEHIREHFGDGAKLGCEIQYSFERTPLGTGGALKLAARQLEDEFIVLNGDTYLDLSYAQLLHRFRTERMEALIAAYCGRAGESRVPADTVACNLGVDSSGSVWAYRKKEPEGLTHVDAGVIVLRKTILKRIPDDASCSLEEEVYPQLIRQGQMRAWITQEPFIDMGTSEGLQALARKFS